MSSRARLILVICCGVLLLVLGTFGVAAAVAYRAGSIEIAVHEKAPDGASVSIRVPAVLLHGALMLLPYGSIEPPEQELRDAMPALVAAVRALERSPDAVFVDVKSRDETVSIAKRDGRLIVDVDAPDATVRVALPLDLVRRVIDRLEVPASRPAGEGV